MYLLSYTHQIAIRGSENHMDTFINTHSPMIYTCSNRDNYHIALSYTLFTESYWILDRCRVHLYAMVMMSTARWASLGLDRGDIYDISLCRTNNKFFYLVEKIA